MKLRLRFYGLVVSAVGLASLYIVPVAFGRLWS
jgi:hypothetical protein